MLKGCYRYGAAEVHTFHRGRELRKEYISHYMCIFIITVQYLVGTFCYSVFEIKQACDVECFKGLQLHAFSS